MMKANPALAPLLVQGVNIFGDENDLPGLADQVIFFGSNLRSDKQGSRCRPAAQRLSSGHRLQSGYRRPD